MTTAEFLAAYAAGNRDFAAADLARANLARANLTHATYSADTTWPAAAAVLLARWGEVSDALCLELMRYDASTHPEPAAFDRWAAGGPCPYEGCAVKRAANFRERRGLWSPGPALAADELVRRLFAEKLVLA